VRMYAPRRSDTVVRKSLNASRICITKCVNYHSSIMEAGEFKEIGMIVLHILCNSDRCCFMHSRLHPTSSCDALSLQGILSRSVSVLLARSGLLLCLAINSRNSVGNSMHKSSLYLCDTDLVRLFRRNSV
jgi:hypothetical protein